MRTVITASLLSLLLVACSPAYREDPSANVDRMEGQRSASLVSDRDPSSASDPIRDPDASTSIPADPEGTSGSEAAGEALPDPVCISPADEGWAPDFVGLSEERATALARSRNLEVREVGRDGECFIITMDLRNNRINLELVDGVVVGAAIY